MSYVLGFAKVTGIELPKNFLAPTDEGWRQDGRYGHTRNRQRCHEKPATHDDED